MNGKPSILVVDPSLQETESLRAMFGGEFEILSAASCSEGLESARHASPDLILLNAALPDCDVFEACGQFKQEPMVKETPLILLGGKEQEGFESKAVKAGCADFIPLPLRPSLTLARVRQHVEAGQYRSILRQISWIDPVTGLPNEAHMESSLQVEWRRAARNRTSLALVLIALDHFEAYQRSHGRHAVEECQRRLSAILGDGIQRAGDVMGRHGGTGFVCILPETDNIGAVSVCERFRAEVYTAAIPNPHAKIGILTVSLGVATLLPSRGDALADLKIATEEALNRAILRGGNQVVFA
ncbi:diguanylate cyclase [Holophaga foetida]|uniref:diguanylate cyclase n=1 Tax=Holophaga foetida TaxID=35839 RepID=UPI0002473380|nr:diguanylate cyclase [Holophaga foetida]